MGRKKGSTISDEQKAKISAALKGRVFSPEHREKMRQARRARVNTYTPEGIERLRKAATKHGYSGDKRDPTYISWKAMKDRCNNPNNPFYYRYGGRGITVCERWSGVDGFINFLADLGERPEKKTLDRINNDGNYCPENCRWATLVEQARHRRKV